MIRSRRLWFTGFLSLLTFALVVVRLGYLQIYCHAELTQRAERERAHQTGESVARGAILDRSGNVLALSLQGGGCYADPKMVKNPQEEARLLASLLGVSSINLKAKLLERRRFVWLARRLNPATVQKVHDLKLPGISVEPEMKRFYPEESLAAQVLGVVGDTGAGLSGVEWTANAWLAGRGMPALFKDWTLAPHPSKLFAAPTELPMNSVVLTLDRTLQTIVEQELSVQMALSRPKNATVIVEDPLTGDILAMASAPTFNPNEWGEAGNTENHNPDTLKNFAVEKVFEPGSTFKIVTAAAALEEHKVTPSESFYCEYGNWQIPGRAIHDHEREGWLTFTDVISHSSNIGTAKAGLRLGQGTLYRYARAFGFGMPSGCGLPGDGVGILHPPNEWHPSSLATISFGQEVGATPLQMVDAYSVIASGGWLMEPRLYKGVIDSKGHYEEWIARPPVRRVISTATVDQMRRILKEVVDRGTGKAAQVPGIEVAGKTGTAQKIDPATHQYSPDLYVASFCGFAPVEHPRLVIGIFLDEPKGTYWGGSEAAPLFSRIVRDAAPYFHLDSGPIGQLASRVLEKT